MRGLNFYRCAVRRKRDDLHAATAHANNLLVGREVRRLHGRRRNRHAQTQYKR